MIQEMEASIPKDIEQLPDTRQSRKARVVEFVVVVIISCALGQLIEFVVAQYRK